MLDIEAIKARQEERKSLWAEYAAFSQIRLQQEDVDDVDALIAAHGMCPGCGHALEWDGRTGPYHVGDVEGKVYCTIKDCPCEDFRR